MPTSLKATGFSNLWIPSGKSSLVDKILEEYTVTLFIPPGYSFFANCHDCGDCACDAERAFPGEEVRILMDGRPFVMFTRDDFQHIMVRKKFGRIKNSLVLELH